LIVRPLRRFDPQQRDVDAYFAGAACGAGMSGKPSLAKPSEMAAVLRLDQGRGA
jgi:hypothetical protein